MGNRCRATIAVVFCAALFAAESSAFASVPWLYIPGPPDGTDSVTLIAACPACMYAATSQGNIYFAYSDGGWKWQKVISNIQPVAITSDASDNLYILNASHIPQIWNNVVGKNAAFSAYPPGAGGEVPGQGSLDCPDPTDIAIGYGGIAYLAGCSSGYIWNAAPKNSYYPKGANWGEAYISANNVVAVGANQMTEGAWVVDSAGLTYALPLSGCGQTGGCKVTASGPIGRPEGVQNFPHSIGVWGGFNNGVAVGGYNTPPNGNGDWPVAYYVSGSTWNWPWQGAYAHAISVNQYTAVILGVAGQNYIYVYTLDD